MDVLLECTPQQSQKRSCKLGQQGEQVWARQDVLSLSTVPIVQNVTNTVYRRNVSTHSNNCMFDVSQDGNNIVWIVATCDIVANQEILVDYSGLEVK